MLTNSNNYDTDVVDDEDDAVANNNNNNGYDNNDIAKITKLFFITY